MTLYLVIEKQHGVFLQRTDKPHGRNSTVLRIGVKVEYRPQWRKCSLTRNAFSLVWCEYIQGYS